MNSHVGDFEEHFWFKGFSNWWQWQLPIPWVVMAMMPEVRMVSREWENDETIRKRLRGNDRRLLFKDPWEDKVKVNVDCAEKNFEVIKPLAKRLKAEDGSVGMHSVPRIEEQPLANQSGVCFLQFLGCCLLSYKDCLTNTTIAGWYRPKIQHWFPTPLKAEDQAALHGHVHESASQKRPEGNGQNTQGFLCAHQKETSEATGVSFTEVPETHGFSVRPWWDRGGENLNKHGRLKMKKLYNNYSNRFRVHTKLTCNPS